MSKFFLVSMAVMVGVGVMPMHATEPSTVLGNADYFGVFPGKYAKDGKSFLFTYERNNDDVIDKFYVYDEGMQLVKEIEPLRFPDRESKYYYQERRYAYEYVEAIGEPSVWNHVVDIDGITTGLNIEQVRDYAVSMFGVGEIMTLSNGVQVVAFDFYERSDYGYQYPRSFYMEVDGEWHRCEQYYEGRNWGPFGEWGNPEERISREEVEADYLEIIPECGGDYESYRLSRGIFGDDYHYLIPTYESRSFEENREYYGKPGWIYEKSWGTRSERIGYTVYDSSNKEVMSFKYPAGYSEGYDPYFFQMGDNRYIAIEDVKNAEGDYFLLVYRLGEGNSVSFVTAAPTSKVSPRNPKRGEKVSVTLDSPVVKDGAMVQVVSASGQTMLNAKIPAGQTQLDINTAGFSQGMYVVTVSGNGITKEAAKIIVR